MRKTHFLIFIIFAILIFSSLLLIPKTLQDNNLISSPEKEGPVIPVTKSRQPQDTKILIVTFNLEDMGAPLMFLHLTKLLHQKGYNVFLLSYDGGRHEEDLKQDKIPYLISQEFFAQSPEEKEKFFSGFDLVISGRIPEIYSPRQEYKFIWWDHGLIDDVPISLFNERTILHGDLRNKILEDSTYLSAKFLIFDAKDVVFVSDFQQKKLHPWRKFSSEIIYNGTNPTQTDMDDPVTKQIQKTKQEGKVVFITVGYIDPIKGQDILIDAVQLLPDNYRKKAAFFIIGSAKIEQYADELREKSKDIPEIVWTGPVLHEKIGGIYESADVLLTHSRSDTAPLVVSEAAEHYMPAVITRNVGSTFIIEDTRSGFIVPKEDPKSLMEKIKFFIDHPSKIKKFGEICHKNYERRASLDAFEKNWINKINRKLEEIENKK